MENYLKKPVKKKQFSKVKALTSVESVKTPKTRRKSLAIPDKKKSKIKQSAPLVLAPPKKENDSIQSGLVSRSSKRNPKAVSKQKLKDGNNSEIEAEIADLETQFNIYSKDVENAVKGVIKFASNNPHLQNQLFNDEIPMFLQINSIKIPNTSGQVKQLFRVPMKHSVLPSDADICLIVPDVKGVPNKDHEKHLEHYENLLHSKDVTGIKKIMTFHEFRTEYDTFELKHRLVDLYDIFLVDGRISGKVVRKSGSIFYNKRKVPVAIKLYLPKLKPHIEQALKKVFIHLNVKSDSHMVQIGHSKMNTKDLVENTYSVIQFLNKQFPGKMENIRSLNVYAHRGSSIPIYVSLKNPNDLKVPTLRNKKPKAHKTYSGELTTQYNADVVVRPSGHISVRRKKHAKKEDNLGGEDNKKVASGKKRKLPDSETNNEIISEKNHLEQSEPKKKKSKNVDVSISQETEDQSTKKSEENKKKKKKGNLDLKQEEKKGITNTPKKNTLRNNVSEKAFKKKFKRKNNVA